MNYNIKFFILFALLAFLFLLFFPLNAKALPLCDCDDNGDCQSGYWCDEDAGPGGKCGMDYGSYGYCRLCPCAAGSTKCENNDVWLCDNPCHWYFDEDCDNDDGWYTASSPYACCKGNKACSNCQDFEYRDYFCSGGSCTYNVTNTTTTKSSCSNCNNDDGWYTASSPYACCDGDKACSNCQDFEYRDYFCSGGSCTYNVTNTTTTKSSCSNCNNDDNCYTYDSGCEDRNYYCSGGSCTYSFSNRHTDYSDSPVNYCKTGTEEVWEHQKLHDYYCTSNTCTDHTSWVNDQLIEDCGSGDYCTNEGCSGGSCYSTPINRCGDGTCNCEETLASCPGDCTVCDCELTDGPCCSNGCDFDSSSTVCDTESGYQCSGSGCGDDYQERTRNIYCPGDAVTCTGSPDLWPDWSTVQDCTDLELCYTTPPYCQYDAGCEPNKLPKAKDLEITYPIEWCHKPPSYEFTWAYEDGDDDPESQYDFQVAYESDTDFDNPVVTRSEVPPNVERVQVLPSAIDDNLTYGEEYRWRVKVYDDKGGESIWKKGDKFDTVDHQYPDIDFDPVPKNPSALENVRFFDKSTCYDDVPAGGDCTHPDYGGNDSFNWNFDVGDKGEVLPAETSILENPVVSFSEPGQWKVTLEVIDSTLTPPGDEYKCSSDERTVNVSEPLPEWIETKP